MKQPELFSGLAIKERELAEHEIKYGSWLKEARNAAYQYALVNSFVTSDDVHRLTPLPPWVHHNAMGAVFNDSRFVAVGFTRTRRRSGHARTIREYQLRDVIGKQR